MATEIENEHTFLIKSLPTNLENWTKEYVKDVYLPPDTDHPQIRIRQRGHNYFLTKKCPLVDGDSSKMQEETIRLNAEEFQYLTKCVGGNVLEKERYKRKEGAIIYEIDCYLGDLKPLIVLDVELENGEIGDLDLGEFGIIKEITQIQSLAAGKLAGKSYNHIKKFL